MSNIRTLVVVFVAFCLGAALMLVYAKRGSTPSTSPPGEPLVLVMRTPGGLLEVSTVRAMESFTSSYVYSFVGVPLGKTVTQIRVPAFYKYQIALAPEWRILRTGKVFTVIPPPVRPGLPIAVDLGKMQQQEGGTWIFAALNNKQQMQALQAGITATLAQRSLNPRYVELQRPHARKTVEEFVRKWLIKQALWQNESGSEIRVLFADEPIGSFERIYGTSGR